MARPKKRIKVSCMIIVYAEGTEEKKRREEKREESRALEFCRCRSRSGSGSGRGTNSM